MTLKLKIKLWILKLRKKRSFADSHPVQTPCSCKQLCAEKINNEKRKTIYMQNCSMDKEN